MAITIDKTPQGVFNSGGTGGSREVVFSRAKLVFVYSSTSTAQTNFKYLIQVEEDGTQIFESYITPNPVGSCMFDLSPIVKERLKAPVTQTAVNGNSIHEGVYGSNTNNKCGGNQNIYTVKVGEVYEVSGVLTEFPNLGASALLVVNGSADYKDSYNLGVFGANRQNLVPFSCNYLAPVELQKGFLSNIEPDTYKQTKNNEYFRDLAGASIAVPTRETDLGAIAWIHDDTYVLQDVVGIKYEWFDSSGTSLADYTSTIATDGGQTLSSTDPTGKVICAPMYWGALSNDGLLVGFYTNSLAWEFYTIQLIRSDDNVANFKWAFYKDCTGNKNELYQLAWTNGVGFWDYYTFMPQTMHETSASKKQYNTNVGSYGADDFTLYPYEAGTKNYQITPKRSWTLSSGKIDEELTKYLKEIIKARQVQLITPEGDVLPVIVDTESTNFYRDRTNKLYDFQVKVTLAQSLEA